MNTYDENRKIYFENLAVQVRRLPCLLPVQPLFLPP